MNEQIIKCLFSKPGKLCGMMKVKTSNYEGERCGLPAGQCAHQGFEQPLPTKCTWSNSEDDSDTHWQTSCGEDFLLNDGTPEDNNMKYCCYCGKPIEQLVTSGSEDDFYRTELDRLMK